MPKYRAIDHRMMKAVAFKPENPAVEVADSILMSESQSNSYLVASDAGDVAINTGSIIEVPRHRERYEELLGRPLDVRKIIFTQSHHDHIGGWQTFNGPGVETIAQARFPEVRKDRAQLSRFYLARGPRALGPLYTPDRTRRYFTVRPEVEVTTYFENSHSFEVGGRRFELYALPGGETLDGLAVWLPAERVLFTGNFTGALFGQFPHLQTIRGDRQRSAKTVIQNLYQLLALEAQLWLTGHDEPIRGEERIRREMTKLREMVAYVHEQTVKGMDEGKDLWTLMAEIELPPELEPAPGRGPIRWYVRTIWEEYAGWFRMESTTELYEVPARAVWPEVVELAGGPEVLAERARAHVEAGRPVEALHLVEMALAADARHRPSREVEIAALEQLIERTQGLHFDELSWLESEIARFSSP